MKNNMIIPIISRGSMNILITFLFFLKKKRRPQTDLIFILLGICAHCSATANARNVREKIYGLVC